MRKATAGKARIMALGFLFICNELANPYEATYRSTLFHDDQVNSRGF